MPVSAVVGRRDVLGVLRPGQHGSTFGGNPLAVAAANTVLDVVRRPRFETWVPGYAKALFHTSNALPRRARDLLSHALGADATLTHVDTGARADYERRAGR
mgnify:CR=1 FL=1